MHLGNGFFARLPMDLRSVSRGEEWRRSDHVDLPRPVTGCATRDVPDFATETKSKCSRLCPLYYRRGTGMRGKGPCLGSIILASGPASAAPCLTSFAARAHALTDPGAIEEPVAAETNPRSSLTLCLDRSFLCHGVYLVLGWAA